MALAVAISLLSSVGRADVQSITIKGALSVFDGDTLEIGPVLIRLHGIDAPENGQTCFSPDGGKWQCGAASARSQRPFLREHADFRIFPVHVRRDEHGVRHHLQRREAWQRSLARFPLRKPKKEICAVA
ncbi:thermonuclease family protein [Roseobacter weihaiensis]|uniref:thermonuclease family protein n=1 Tax=Roseobacter weihaiensis TaxID=2763262 RepID=UPI001D0AAE2A|nr:hypothetical protein [Roseobacter sp. H9]